MAVLDVTPDKSAVIPVVRGAVTHPPLASPLLTVATAGFEEVQLAALVISRKVPSVNVPMAVNCSVCAKLQTIVAGSGVTSIDTSSAGVIVSVALFDVMPEELAVIVVAPTDFDTAIPFEPVVLLINATAAFVEFQVTDDVIFFAVWSVNVPVAVYCWVLPRTRL